MYAVIKSNVQMFVYQGCYEVSLLTDKKVTVKIYRYSKGVLDEIELVRFPLSRVAFFTDVDINDKIKSLNFKYYNANKKLGEAVVNKAEELMNQYKKEM